MVTFWEMAAHLIKGKFQLCYTILYFLVISDLGFEINTIPYNYFNGLN